MGLIDEQRKTARAVEFQTASVLKQQSKAEAERIKTKNYKLSLQNYFWNAFRHCENVGDQLQDFYKIDTRLKVIETLAKEVDDIRELNALYDAELQKIYKIFKNQESQREDAKKEQMHQEKLILEYKKHADKMEIERQKLEIQRQKLNQQQKNKSNSSKNKTGSSNIIIMLLFAPLFILWGILESIAKSK